MQLDERLLDTVYKSMAQGDDYDPDFDLIAAVNITAEIMECTRAHLSPRKRIRIWSQHVREQH